MNKIIADASPFEKLKETIGSTTQPGKDVLEGKFISLDSLANVLVNLLVGVGFAIGLVGLAYGFVQYVMSEGEKDKIAKAQSAITFSVIAIIVSLLAVTIKIIFFALIGTTNVY